MVNILLRFLSPPLLWEGDIAITFPAALAALAAAATATYISAIPGPIFFKLGPNDLLSSYAAGNAKISKVKVIFCSMFRNFYILG